MKILINKILNVLNKKQKFEIFLLSFLSIIRTLLEMIGIGLLIPILTFITDFEKSYKYFDYIDFISGYDQKKIILFFVICFLIIYLIKTIFVIFYNVYVSKFSQNLFFSISKKILSKYLDKNYIFFVQNNSANLIRNISGESNLFALGIVSNFIVILSNVTLFIGICTLLILYNNYSVFVIIILVLLSFLIIKIFDKKFKKWGEIRQDEAANFLKKLNEIFGSIKEAIIYDKKSFFLRQASGHLKNFANAARYKDAFLSISSPIIEFIGIFIFFSFFLFLVFFTSAQYSEIIVIFGIFAFASLRLLPNLIQIVKSFQNLKYNLPAAELVYKELNDTNFEKNLVDNSLNNLQKINFDNVSFKYPSKSNLILENINIEINSSDKIGIIGETGSGKTTLLNLISGLLEPTDGKIKINSSDIIGAQNIQKSIGYVSQNIYLSDDTIYFNIALSDELDEKSKSKIDNLIKILNLDNIENINSKLFNIGERGSKLSGGQVQRIGIARALYRDPSILILDEATNALDVSTEKKVLDFLYNQFEKKIMIFCTHKEDLLKDCNKIFEIKNKTAKLVRK